MKFLLAATILLSSCLCLAAEPAPKTVKVAALQCWTPMGEIKYNRKLLSKMVEIAAKQGAKIVVTPECAVQGYMDPIFDIGWSSKAKPDKWGKSVAAFAETIPGPSTKHFSQLAAKHKLYLCIGIIEKDKKLFYNAQVLFNPKGKMIAHHRKQVWWIPGDAAAFTKGTKPLQVVDTEYGRMGLMICFEVHRLPEELAKKKVDIVLYSVAWYGGNTKNWFKNIFPLKHVQPNKFAVIAANWSSPLKGETWDGAGYSTIYDHTGKVLAQVNSDRKPRVLIAEIPLKAKQAAKAVKQ